MSNTVGLQNQGATCYLNTLIQLLSATPELTNELFELDEKDIFDEDTTLSPRKSVLLEFMKLLAQMANKSNLSISTKGLTNAFGWNEKQVYQQHDINDAYNQILDILDSAMPEHRKFLKKYYKGKSITVTVCDECGNISKYIQPFTQIDANVICAANNLYESLISSYFSSEKLCGDNKYYCIECEEKVIATKQTRLIDLPIILTFNLNRFLFHLERVKLNSKFLCPLTLDLSLFVDNENKKMNANIINEYDLFGIAVHDGNGAGSGHYRAFVKNLSANIWTQYDDQKAIDSSVKEIEKLFEKSKSTPYMLMYRRKYMDAKLLEIPKFISDAMKEKN